MSIIDRQRGCLLGLAIGDALGQPVEFMERGSFPPITTYRSGGPHSLEKGQFTDDTSMALALADSICQKGWDLDDQIKRYVDWWQNGKYSVNGWCFDIGGTTQTSLSNYMETGDVLTCSDTHAASSGNGSIMRLAPVPIKYANLYPLSIQKLKRLGEESSITTHASKQCRSACRYLTAVLAALINGVPREEVLNPDWPLLDMPGTAFSPEPQIDKVVKGSFRTSKTIKGSGWVVESLEAALWAFHDAKDFEEAVLKAVNLGLDADTTGSVTGQLAGAYWGNQESRSIYYLVWLAGICLTTL